MSATEWMSLKRLIGFGHDGVDPYQVEKKEAYAKVLDVAQPYLPRHQPKEVFHVEVPSSNLDKKSTLEVELKPLPPHLRYEFLGPNRTFSVIVSAKLSDAQI